MWLSPINPRPRSAGHRDHPAPEADHGNGPAAVRPCSIAELAADVQAPAPDGAAAHEGAAVLAAKADRDRTLSEAGDGYRPQPRLGGPVTELPVLAVAPALDGVGVGERAAVVAASGDRLHTAD